MRAISISPPLTGDLASSIIFEETSTAVREATFLRQ